MSSFSRSLLTELSFGVAAAEGQLVLGQLVAEALVLLLQGVHCCLGLACHTAAAVALEGVVVVLPAPHQTQHQHCVGEEHVMNFRIILIIAVLATLFCHALIQWLVNLHMQE